MKENLTTYLYDTKTGEFQGASGFLENTEQGSTTLPPLEPKEGYWIKWNGTEWVYEVDNRGKTVYSKSTGELKGIWNSVNPLNDDYTTIEPPKFGVWTGDEWEISAIAENKWQMKQTIAKNKELLEKDDYKVIKCLEQLSQGEPTDYDLKVLHEQRQKLRDEINTLEKALY